MKPGAHTEAPVVSVRAKAYKIPTDKPEADGTYAWDHTTLVVVEVEGGGKCGLGYTYSDASIACLIEKTLGPVVEGVDALDPPKAWRAMAKAVRNLGREGLAATAISAIDAALWDLKAKLLDLPLVLLLGRVRNAVRIYGSGGFTTYSDDELRVQLSGWVERDGCRDVKMKIGTDPASDPHRVKVAKQAIGAAHLFVDANGAFSAKQALCFAELYTEQQVRWFEEPVTSDDLAGLALLRRDAPPGMDIAAGEYGYTIDYFEKMLRAQAVDCQQADLTRCGGVTAFLRVASLCESHHVDLSGHCAPTIHLHVACAAPRLRHLEWFHDHVRIEQMLFEGAPVPRDGTISPDLSRPGLGFAFKFQDAEPFRVA
jgi:L-alanine-DL-glutamate epimerase-like enolase superfamily enzyme